MCNILFYKCDAIGYMCVYVNVDLLMYFVWNISWGYSVEKVYG